MSSFRRLRPGQVPTAAEFNRVLDLLEGLTDVGGSFGDTLGFDRGNGAGIRVLDQRPQGHWAKVTGRDPAGNHYSHITAVPNGDGTFTDVPTGTDGSIWGTVDSGDAREVNGRIDFDAALPFYTWLRPDFTEATPGWVFEYDGGRLGCFARLTTSSGGKWKWVAQTLDSGGSWVDDGSESSTYNAVPSTYDGTNYGTTAAGTRVWMWASKQPGLYEFLPVPSGATRFGRFARLTTSSSGKWKWYEQTLDGSGAWVDLGLEAASYNAVPSPLDATYSMVAAAGVRVWLWDSRQAGLYEFLPLGYADDTHPGLVSVGDQTFKGPKRFDDGVQVIDGGLEVTEGGLTVKTPDYAFGYWSATYSTSQVYTTWRDTAGGSVSAYSSGDAFGDGSATLMLIPTPGAVGDGVSLWVRGGGGNGGRVVADYYVSAGLLFQCNGADGQTADVALSLGGSTVTLHFVGGIFTGYDVT